MLQEAQALGWPAQLARVGDPMGAVCTTHSGSQYYLAGQFGLLALIVVLQVLPKP